jgi:hypothetical protein
VEALKEQGLIVLGHRLADAETGVPPVVYSPNPLRGSQPPPPLDWDGLPPALTTDNLWASSRWAFPQPATSRRHPV